MGSAGGVAGLEVIWGEGKILRLGGRVEDKERSHRRNRPLICLCFSSRKGENPCCLACIPGGECLEQRMLDGSVGSLMAHQPGLRPPSPPSSPSTQHRALACLWNFPGGNLPQKPSLAPHAQYILSPVPPPLTPSSPGLQQRAPWSTGPSSQGDSKAAKEGNRSPGDPHVPLPTLH